MYSRICKSCKKEIKYKHKKSFLLAERRGSLCKSCSHAGIKRSEETIKKLSELAKKRIGQKNSFYGKNHNQETINRIRNINLGKRYTEEINKRKGRPGREPSNKGIPLTQEAKDKISKKTRGENNPMYGKPSPRGSGNGWSGWYKGTYFRSLKELSFIKYYLERFNFLWETAEKKKYRISYDNGLKNYYADFIVDSYFMVEIKPKKLWGSKNNILKKEAADKFCKFNNLKYKIIDPVKIISIEEVKEELDLGNLKFIERYEQAFDNMRADSKRKDLP
ncbi:MAG TPA: NUMOD3 domain-containing DNA-binding protein [Candidatus Paceibacterota bacterium]|nr:NUMOD3 domain-containing DNA-binding protein [Candidatus Paceibacterota bacterium]